MEEAWPKILHDEEEPLPFRLSLQQSEISPHQSKQHFFCDGNTDHRWELSFCILDGKPQQFSWTAWRHSESYCSWQSEYFPSEQHSQVTVSHHRQVLNHGMMLTWTKLAPVKKKAYFQASQVSSLSQGLVSLVPIPRVERGGMKLG